ncbi:hypothetical protein ALP99_200027 [Pseudomonas syringae pv. tomato]|nr:hypothetical protein ALP99_200027 [Pseudomonas syringae pv. tomato]
MCESLNVLTQHFICTLFQCGGSVILLSRDRDNDILLCPLIVFELVLQFLKRNLEALSAMSKCRLVITYFRTRSPSKSSQIAWRAPKLVVEGLESQ